MAVKVIVRNKRQIIVPLRFGRAVEGGPVSDAPDVDDRGFALGSRYETWGKTNTRGPQVSMTAGDTIRIKIITEDIDSKIDGTGKLQLFATSSNIQVVTVVNQGQPIETNGTEGVFSIKGLVDLIDVPVKVQIHMNSTQGPVLAEIEPHIFQLRQLNVKAHRPTINGASSGASTSNQSTRSDQNLVDLFNAVNVIWRAAGIQFVFDQNEIDDQGSVTLTYAGAVTTSNNNYGDLDKLFQVNADSNRINVYFVPTSSNPNEPEPWWGITTAPGGDNAAGCAVVDQGVYQGEDHHALTDAESAQVLAHELGHYLDLLHYNEHPSGHEFRQDIWSERHLMFAGVHLGDLDSAHLYRSDVGYGFDTAGALIDLKNLNADPEDGELHIARRASLAIAGGA